MFSYCVKACPSSKVGDAPDSGYPLGACAVFVYNGRCGGQLVSSEGINDLIKVSVTYFNFLCKVRLLLFNRICNIISAFPTLSKNQPFRANWPEKFASKR